MYKQDQTGRLSQHNSPAGTNLDTKTWHWHLIYRINNKTTTCQISVRYNGVSFVDCLTESLHWSLLYYYHGFIWAVLP